MIDEPRNNPSKPDFKFAGVGMEARRMCMGCNLPRSIICSAGTGIRWRCMDCLATARAKDAAAGAKEPA